jgi:nucleotide-binding universal stress UspA family protein
MDAVETCRVAFPRIADAGGRPLVVHVIEKAGGAPDKAGVEQREAAAEAAFDAARACADGYEFGLETEILYDTDVADAIIEMAADIDASAIVFRPRSGSSWLSLLTGDVREQLVTESGRPVVVLPDPGGAADEIGGRATDDR